MVLEEGESHGRMCFWVLKWLILPTLTSFLLSMVLERLEVNGFSPLRAAVFLLPWWLAWGVTLLPVLDSAVSTMVSAKVTCLVVFLLLLGGGSATWSMDVVAAKLGT